MADPTKNRGNLNSPSSQSPDALGSEAKLRTRASDPVGRRKHERVQLQLDVSLYSDDNFYAGFTENLSAGGVFVATHDLRPLGEKISVTITLPTEQQIVAHGVVRWLREYNPVNDVPPGMGIEFLEVQGEDLMIEFLNARPPLFYDD